MYAMLGCAMVDAASCGTRVALPGRAVLREALTRETGSVRE